MSFRKLAQNAKKLNTTFTGSMPVGDGETFLLTFQLITGKEGLWIYRENLTNESYTSFSMVVDHRSACASLLSLNDGEETLSPVDLVKILYPEELLRTPVKALEREASETEELSAQVIWASIVEKCKTVEDYPKLTLGEKELVWDLLHHGLNSVYDPEFNFAFTNTWISAYRQVKPSPEAIQLQKSIDELKKSIQQVQESLDTPEEAKPEAKPEAEAVEEA